MYLAKSVTIGCISTKSWYCKTKYLLYKTQRSLEIDFNKGEGHSSVIPRVRTWRSQRERPQAPYLGMAFARPYASYSMISMTIRLSLIR
jgi:hypothetical protein